MFVFVFNKCTFILDNVFSESSLCPFAFSSNQATPVIILLPFAISSLPFPSSSLSVSAFSLFASIIWFISEVVATLSPNISAYATFVIGSAFVLSTEYFTVVDILIVLSDCEAISQEISISFISLYASIVSSSNVTLSTVKLLGILSIIFSPLTPSVPLFFTVIVYSMLSPAFTYWLCVFVVIFNATFTLFIFSSIRLDLYSLFPSLAITENPILFVLSNFLIDIS